MHDPNTVAFEVYGLRGLFYRWVKNRALRRDDPNWTRIKSLDPLAVVWHVDPESNGSDDSCGYSYAGLNKEEREKVGRLAKEMAGSHLEEMFGKSPDSGYFALRSYVEMILGGFEVVAWRVFKKQIKPRHLPQILSAACYPHDNLQSLLPSPLSEYDIERFFMILARNFKTYDRRWWEHPRFHVNHWKIQLPLLLDLKRCLFSRCAGCGRWFSFGYSPVTTQWHSKGPQWFRSESNIYHSECHR